jgi:Protein of unknown function (DUF2934)
MYERITKQLANAWFSDRGALEQMFCQAAKLQHQAIALRAYRLFLERGGAHGNDQQDWFAAKREMIAPG